MPIAKLVWNLLFFLSFHSIDKEKNRLALSLLEADTGVPENIDKKFRKRLRRSSTDVASDVADDSTMTASKKSVKRKADADDDVDRSKVKRAKVEPAKALSKEVKQVNTIA